MPTIEEARVRDIWQEIREWPAPQRLSPATRIMESLSGTTEAGPKGPPISTMAGLPATGQSTPTDEEVEILLADALREKHLR